MSVASPTVGRAPVRRRRGPDFVAKTLAGLTDTLVQAVFSDEKARRPGLLQRRDARAKAVAALLMLVVVGLAHSTALILLVHITALLLAGVSMIEVGPFARRVWLGVPVFAGVVILPSLFLLPGDPLLVLVDAPPAWLAISDSGAAVAARFVIRVAASVSLALLLVSTTRWTDLLRALKVLKVPESFVLVLGMTYRYLFLFLHAASGLFLARRSRTVGRSSGGEQRRWAGGAAGSLVSRSVRLSNDVMLAMRARGFGGELRSLEHPGMRDEDWLLMALSVVAAAAVLLLDGRLS